MQELEKELLKRFNYNPETGFLTYTEKKGRILPGTIAGHLGSTKYLQINHKGKVYTVHRLAFLFMTGKFPEKGLEVDHIDTDKLNNCWSNLRLATKAQNQANSSLRSSNTSGIKGVCWHSRDKKWFAQIYQNGVTKSLGYFTDIKEAEEAVRNFRTLQHKEFTNHGTAL